jgi:hypothetical protein
MESRVMCLILGTCLMLPCLVPLVLQSIILLQDHYRGHYREKNSCPCNDAIKNTNP